MQAKTDKKQAFFFVCIGVILLLAGFSALVAFLGLPLQVPGDFLSRQIGAMAAVWVGLGCGSLALIQGVGWLRSSPSRSFLLPPGYFFWILFGLALGVGNLLLNARSALDLLFPVIFLMGAALPALAVMAQGAHRLGGDTTWRDVSLMFVTGSTISVLAAVLLESILPMLAYLFLSPLGLLSESFASLALSTPGLLERIFFSPLLIVFLLFTAIHAPLPEEFAKALGPALFVR